MGATRRRARAAGSRLFNDRPDGKPPLVAGIGYGSAEKARASIRRIAGKPLAYRHQVATTMFYRAKHHKYQTKGMREAQAVWGAYRRTLRAGQRPRA